MVIELTSSMEDYLETVYVIEKEKRVARITEISKKMQVKKSSVTNALNTLKGYELINYEPYSYITLTDKGRKLAKEILNKHEVFSELLSEVFKFSNEDSEDISCKFEHIVSCDSMKKFKAMLDFFNDNKDIKSKWISYLEKNYIPEISNFMKCEVKK